jgi:hypothetical protein
MIWKHLSQGWQHHNHSYILCLQLKFYMQALLYALYNTLINPVSHIMPWCTIHLLFYFRWFLLVKGRHYYQAQWMVRLLNVVCMKVLVLIKTVSLELKNTHLVVFSTIFHCEIILVSWFRNRCSLRCWYIYSSWY